MNETYYTVEQIARMLHMHPKTVQRYIREGKIPARKIGKGWRVSGHDLSCFVQAEGTVAGGEILPPQERATVSSVADIAVKDREAAIRVVNLLTAVLNSKPPEYGRSTMHAQFLEAEGKVRVTLWGTLRFMAEMLDALASLTEEGEDGL